MFPAPPALIASEHYRPAQVLMAEAAQPTILPTTLGSTETTGAIAPDVPLLPTTPVADEGSALEQVTSVAQLTDVRPGDWAFQALQALVERYGCLAGYPNKTFRGIQALSRYEFAAGLNACINRIQELMAAGTTELVKQEDLRALQKLQEAFAAELSALRGRVDALEARAATLEKQQFSTTTILQGQVVFGLATATGGKPPGRGENNPILTDLVQLQLVSSFTKGRDLLRIGLASSNIGNDGFAGFQSLNTNMALLSFQGSGGNQLVLNTVDYRFALGDRLVVALQPVGFSLSSVLSPNSSYSDAGQGAVSRFAAINPVFRLGNLDAGVGLDWLLSNKWRLQLAYGARSAATPSEGLFGSNHQALGVQALYRPNARMILGFAYVNAYASDGRLDTFTGSNNADISGGFDQPATIHALSATMRWRLSPTVTLGLSGGALLTDSTFGKIFRVIGNANINLKDLGAVTLSSTYLISLGIDDPFGRKGDQFVVMVGQPPKLNLGVVIERVDQETSLHFESFYRWRVNDGLSLIPGFFYVTNPGHIGRNNGIFVGTLRATFSF